MDQSNPPTKYIYNYEQDEIIWKEPCMSGRNLNATISNKNAWRREFYLYAHFPFKGFANFQPSQD